MKKILLFTFPILILSCAQKDRADEKRIDLKAMQIDAKAVENLPAFESALEKSEILACARVQQLKAQKFQGAHFRYFGRARNMRGVWTGAVDIDGAPLFQHALATDRKLPELVNEENFYEEAKKKYEKGELSSTKWLMVKLLHTVGLVGLAQFPAMNQGVQEKFPGAFGDEGALAASLPMQLATRSAKLAKLSSDKVSSALEAKMPLFPHNGKGWAGYAEETKKSLAAAVAGARSGNELEKLCAHILLTQHFNQLLRMNGHQSPVMVGGTRTFPFSRLKPLSSDQPTFKKIDRNGAFFDPIEESAVILEKNTIESYDPTSMILGTIKNVPGSKEDNQAGGLAESIAVMEALAYGFEVSSPASPVVYANEAYYGDIVAENSKSAVPSEAHALSLGLLGIQFKNLAALHLKKVNANGKEIAPGESASGVVITSEPGSTSVANVKLEEIARLVKVLSYLHHSLEALTTRSVEELGRLNPVYKAQEGSPISKVLLSLLGTSIYSKETIDQVMPKGFQGVVMVDNIKALKFPLAVLLGKMAKAEGCVSELEWNASTGSLMPKAECSPEQKLMAVEALEILGRDTRSSLILKNAEALKASLPVIP